MIKQFRAAGLTKPYKPFYVEKIKSLLSRKHSKARKSGLFVFGCGKKAVHWYWEFDVELKYYCDFRTSNLERAMKIFKSEKGRMWDVGWEQP